MKKLPGLCQAFTYASWWSLLGTESCLFLLEGWKFPSNKFMTIFPKISDYHALNISLERLLVIPANLISGIPTDSILPVKTTFSLEISSLSWKSNLRRSKNSVTLEFLYHAAQGWGVPGDTHDLPLYYALYYSCRSQTGRKPCTLLGQLACDSMK